MPRRRIDVALAQVALREGRDGGARPGRSRPGNGDGRPRPRRSQLVHRLADSPRLAGRAERWLARPTGPASRSARPGPGCCCSTSGTTFAARCGSRHAGVVGARVDLLVGDRVVVEFDGLVKYEGAEGRAALAAEKRREDWLRSLGYEVVRLTWADLDRPRRVDAPGALPRSSGRHGVRRPAPAAGLLSNSAPSRDVGIVRAPSRGASAHSGELPRHHSDGAEARAGSVAAGDPVLQVRGLGADGGRVAVAGQHHGVRAAGRAAGCGSTR